MDEESTRLNCYELLQVHPAAPLDLITAAYWRLAEGVQRRRSSQAEAGELLHRLTTAYETLARPELRAAYDARVGLGSHGPLPATTRPRRRRWGLFPRGGNGDAPAPDRGVDYYEVLRVDRTASSDIVELAYATMRDYYLRVVSAGAAPPELMDLLAEAHAVTSNPDLRRSYDERVSGRKRSPPPDGSEPPDPPASETQEARASESASADAEGGIPHDPQPPASALRSEVQGQVWRALRAGAALAARGCWKLLTLVACAGWWLALQARKVASAAVNAALDRLSERLIDYRAQHGTNVEAEEAVLQRLSLLTPEPPGGEAQGPAGGDAGER